MANQRLHWSEEHWCCPVPHGIMNSQLSWPDLNITPAAPPPPPHFNQQLSHTPRAADGSLSSALNGGRWLKRVNLSVLLVSKPNTDVQWHDDFFFLDDSFQVELKQENLLGWSKKIHYISTRNPEDINYVELYSNDPLLSISFFWPSNGLTLPSNLFLTLPSFYNLCCKVVLFLFG